MGRLNLEDAKLYDCFHENGTKFGPLILTLGGNITIDRDSPTLLSLDPGGASRNVTLPAVERGLLFIILNQADAAEDLVIKNPGATTIATISQNEMGLAVCDGVAWKAGTMLQT